MATDTPMQLGMVGLGRMGAGIVRRLMKDGHRCVGYDVSPDAVKALEADGADGRDVARGVRVEAREAARGVGDGSGRRHHRQDDRRARRRPRAGRRRSSTAATRHYHDDIRHAAMLREKGIHHVDVGTSGGVWGFERGFCLMIGGEDEVVDRLEPDLRLDRAGRRRRAAHAGTHRRPEPRPSTATTTAARTAPGTS